MANRLMKRIAALCRSRTGGCPTDLLLERPEQEGKISLIAEPAVTVWIPQMWGGRMDLLRFWEAESEIRERVNVLVCRKELCIRTSEAGWAWSFSSQVPGRDRRRIEVELRAIASRWRDEEERIAAGEVAAAGP